MPDVLRGDLGGVSLASVLQLIELECFCGDLLLPAGEFRFHNGALVGGTYLALRDADAAVEALVRARGRFSLVAEVRLEQPAIAQISQLVIESCRILDELERLAPARLVVVDRSVARGELGRLLDAVPEHGTMAAALVAEELHVVRVLDPLLRAIDQRAVELGPVEPIPLSTLHVGGIDRPRRVAPEVAATPPPAPTAGPSFDDLVFDARKHVRNRAWEAAEAALRRALELRPGSPIVSQNLNRVRSLRAAE